MQAHGTDRMRPGTGDQVILSCRRSKGWTARVEKTLTTARHPGTAVLWEEKFFEVVIAEPGPAGSVRYVLEPWHDEHIIRLSEPYDAASEARREVERQAASSRETKRKTANLAGIFTGLLPAIVQEHLASELGLLPAKLTALSLLVPFPYILWVANDVVKGIMNPGAKTLPRPFALAAAYLLFETLIRLSIVWLQARPVGSVLGFVPYVLYYVTIGRSSGAISPFAEQRGQKLFHTEPAEDVALRDAFLMREPLLTLLSPAEQNALAERFGFNYRTHGFIVAFVILLASVAGVITGLISLQHGARLGAFLSILAGIGLGAEQFVRLAALQRGPAGSVLGALVRPFARKLLL